MRLHCAAGSSLVLCALVSTAVVAQSAGTTVELGVVGGAAFSKPGGKDATRFNATYTGVTAGGFVRLGLSRYFAVQPELAFVQKGAKLRDPGGTSTIKVGYLEVPVLAQARFPRSSGGLIVPHLYAGPALAVKVGCSLHGTGTGQPISPRCEDEGVQMKGTDFSLVFGGGADIGRAVVGVRYDMGLGTVDDSSSPEEVKHRTWNFLVGWRFGPRR